MATDKTLTLRLISHGVHESGGSVFEEFLLVSLAGALRTKGVNIKEDRKIFRHIFRGIQNLSLLAKCYFSAAADINIAAGRAGLSSVIRNLTNKGHTLIVLYNYDSNDGKSLILKWYYKVLFALLRTKPASTAIITQSDYFRSYFDDITNGLPIFKIPNLFDTKRYSIKGVIKNPKKIFLGQFSEKNDTSVYQLAAMLTEAGYYCFFCTLNPAEVQKQNDYDVIKVPFDEYIRQMAESYATIAFTGINEGWNRLAHESLLAGTPVIGYAKGGLGDLLLESGSYIVNSAGEAFDLIIKGELRCRHSAQFVHKYDISNTGQFLGPLVQYLTA